MKHLSVSSNLPRSFWNLRSSSSYSSRFLPALLAPLPLLSLLRSRGFLSVRSLLWRKKTECTVSTEAISVAVKESWQNVYVTEYKNNCNRSTWVEHAQKNLSSGNEYTKKVFYPNSAWPRGRAELKISSHFIFA